MYYHFVRVKMLTLYMIEDNVINKAILTLFTITTSSKLVSNRADNSFIISSQKIVNV